MYFDYYFLLIDAFFFISWLIYLIYYFSKNALLIKERDKNKIKYRDKCQIYYVIVKNCIGKYQTKNKLSYYSSYKRLNEYLMELMQLELLLFDTKAQKFIATPKGNDFVRKYDDILDFIPSFKNLYEI